MNNIEKVVLPSNGLLEDVPQEVTIRGMKGIEISTLFSSLTDAAIDNIIRNVVEPDIDTDLLCDEDKKFILYKTRELTFGDTIKQKLVCPHCGKINTYEFKHGELEVDLLEEEALSEKITLEDGTTITKKIPTKKDWKKVYRYKEKRDLPEDYSFILLFAARIDKVNGKRLALGELIAYLENIQGAELLKITESLGYEFGLQTNFMISCLSCGERFLGGISINADLFR